MSDQEGSGGAQPPRAPDQPSRVAPRIGRIKRYLQERRAEKQHESLTDRAARSPARATWAIAFLTIATIAVGASQYIIFDRQLGKMKAAREGGDTATKTQLSLMRDQTTAMQQQLAAMQTASAQTERAIAATNHLADEAAKSATESH